jgi:protein-disulfide isomerase-like protein with CxxC motif
VPVHVSYVTDPACPASWGLEPTRRRLLAEFGDEVAITYVMGDSRRTHRTALTAPHRTHRTAPHHTAECRVIHPWGAQLDTRCAGWDDPGVHVLADEPLG